MSDFNGYTSGRSTARGVRQLQKQIQTIKNSNLSQEEKEKALKIHRKMLITTIIVVVLITLLLAIAVLTGLFIGGDAGMIFLVISMVVAMVLLLVYAIIARNIFKDFSTYYAKAKNG